MQMPQFWKVRNIPFGEGKLFLKFTPKAGRVSYMFLLPPELIWGSSMPGVWDIINLSQGPIQMTNYNFHPHVQYCINIHYHSCSIDKYRYVKDVKCHSCGRLGISHLGRQYSWAQVNWTHVSTTLGHQMPLPGVLHLSKDQPDQSLTKCQADLM